MTAPHSLGIIIIIASPHYPRSPNLAIHRAETMQAHFWQVISDVYYSYYVHCGFVLMSSSATDSTISALADERAILQSPSPQ